MTLTRENLSIEIAVLVSLLLHAMTFGVYQQRDVIARLWLFKPIAKKMAAKPAVAARKVAPAVPVITFVDQPAPQKKVEPRIFIETDDSQVAKEQPQNTPFYSDRATAAANPDNRSNKLGDTPYLDGREDRMLSSESVPIPRPGTPYVPPLPAGEGGVTAESVKGSPADAIPQTRDVPPREQRKEAAARGLTIVDELKQAQEQKQQAIRELARLGPKQPPPPSVATPAVKSPTGREIVASKSRLIAAGVNRQGVAAFNVAGSPFGAYDKKLIQAVQSRWLALIDRYSVYERAGTVTLHFELYDDGKVANLRRKENSAGEMLALFCEKAVTDSAPFDPLTESLRTQVGKEPREINFTFYY